MKSILLGAASLASVILAGPCPDERDPGCCLQKTSVTYPNGTVAMESLGFDATLNQCMWPMYADGANGAGNNTRTATPTETVIVVTTSTPVESVMSEVITLTPTPSSDAPSSTTSESPAPEQTPEQSPEPAPESNNGTVVAASITKEDIDREVDNIGDTLDDAKDEVSKKAQDVFGNDAATKSGSMMAFSAFLVAALLIA